MGVKRILPVAPRIAPPADDPETLADDAAREATYADFRRARLRPTYNRLTVHAVLAGPDAGWLEAHEVVRLLLLQGRPFHVSSVYLTLRELVQHGIAQRQTPADGKSLFALAPRD